MCFEGFPSFLGAALSQLGISKIAVSLLFGIEFCRSNAWWQAAQGIDGLLYYLSVHKKPLQSFH